ncbi:MAG: protein-disulfide reductase DsbD domain-containing protein, partial [Verrucomicrobiota bacterium]
MKRFSPFARILVLFGSLAVALSSFAAESESIRDKHVDAQLISDHAAITPGQTFTLGLRFSIDPTWHTYWINPGETGKPTNLELTLPEGFAAGSLQFPVPKRFVTDYGFNILEAGFGYEDSVIHPIEITAPDSLEAGDSVTIMATADWLMCDPKSCVPGKAEFTLTIDVAEEAKRSSHASSLELYAKKLPKTVAWPTEASLADGKITVSSMAEDAIPEDATLHLFPYETKIFDQLSEPKIAHEAGRIAFTFDAYENLTAAPEPFAALLVVETDQGKTGYRLSTDEETGETPPRESTTPSVSSATDSTSLPFGGGLIGVLFAAFLGGIILNIMPCVFPVISLKVMSFVGQAGEDRKKVLAHSLTFALGILVFFWILTTAMLILRALGSDDVGWGVQLRQPGFVIGLIFVMVIVAMSLFGVFEIGASMTAVGGELTNKTGYAGSFWSGALAVLLATPCTAPLMAPAIGFALSQSAFIMFLVFTTLGLGLAAPYFVFAAFPKLLEVIPPPGAWMETFKQFMGFPMLAVAVWLVGVLSKQLNVGGLQWALAAVL